MKYQALLSQKTMKKHSRLSSAAVVIGALRIKYIGKPSCFSVIFTQNGILCDFQSSFRIVSTLEGKNFHLIDQILPIVS